MNNVDETILSITNYLKKLVKIIETQADFTFLDVKIVDKNKIDDIFCCIEASFPEEYKNSRFLESQIYKSFKMYSQLQACIRRKNFLFPKQYSIKYKEALSLISVLPKIFERDIRACMGIN